jgi:hypothetical protein
MAKNGTGWRIAILAWVAFAVLALVTFLIPSGREAINRLPVPLGALVALPTALFVWLVVGAAGEWIVEHVFPKWLKGLCMLVFMSGVFAVLLFGFAGFFANSSGEILMILHPHAFFVCWALPIVLGAVGAVVELVHRLQARKKNP